MCSLCIPKGYGPMFCCWNFDELFYSLVVTIGTLAISIHSFVFDLPKEDVHVRKFDDTNFQLQKFHVQYVFHKEFVSTKSIDRIAAQAAAIDKGALEELERARLLCFFICWLIRLIWNNCSVAIMLLLCRQILLIFMNPRMQIIFLVLPAKFLWLSKHILLRLRSWWSSLETLLSSNRRLLLCPSFFLIYLLSSMLCMLRGSVADVLQNSATLSTWSMKKLNSSLILMLLLMLKTKAFYSWPGHAAPHKSLWSN